MGGCEHCDSGANGQTQSSKQKSAGSDAEHCLALLGKARRWFEMLRTGAIGSIGELARQVNMAGSDVTQIVYLAFMAPDLIERIAAGAQPPGFGVGKLLAASPLPLHWGEQRRVLGFEG